MRRRHYVQRSTSPPSSAPRDPASYPAGSGAFSFKRRVAADSPACRTVDGGFAPGVDGSVARLCGLFPETRHPCAAARAPRRPAPRRLARRLAVRRLAPGAAPSIARRRATRGHEQSRRRGSRNPERRHAGVEQRPVRRRCRVAEDRDRRANRDERADQPRRDQQHRDRRRRRVRWVGREDPAPTGAPSIRTEPADGSSSPAMIRTAVVFPDPLCPITATHSPAATSSSSPCSASRSP